MIFLIFLSFFVCADEPCFRGNATTPSNCQSDVATPGQGRGRGRTTPIAPAKPPEGSCYEDHKSEWGITFTNLRTRWAVVVANCQQEPGGGSFQNAYADFTQRRFNSYIRGIESYLGNQWRKTKSHGYSEATRQESLGYQSSAYNSEMKAKGSSNFQSFNPGENHSSLERYQTIGSYEEYHTEKTYDEYDKLHAGGTNAYCKKYVGEFKTAMSLQSKEELEKYIEGCTVACGGKDCYESGAPSTTTLAAPKPTSLAPARASGGRRGSGVAVRPTVKNPTSRRQARNTPASSPAIPSATAPLSPSAATRPSVAINEGETVMPRAATTTPTNAPVLTATAAPETPAPAKVPTPKPSLQKSDTAIPTPPVAPSVIPNFDGVDVLRLANSHPPKLKESTRYYKECGNDKLKLSTNYVYKTREIETYVQNCKSEADLDKIQGLQMGLNSFRQEWGDNVTSKNSKTPDEVSQLLTNQIQGNKELCNEIKEKYEASIQALQVAATTTFPGRKEALIHGLVCPAN